MASFQELFSSFFRVGAVLFGGGYAMLPLLEREVVDRRHWVSHDELADLFVIAQLIPGVIAINTSMLIGNRLRGGRGAAVAMLGTILVPIAVILAYAIALTHFHDSVWLTRATAGLRPAVAGMLFGIAATMFRDSAKAWRGRLIFFAVLAAVFLFKLSAITVILSGLLSSLALWLHVRYQQRRGMGQPPAQR